MKHASRRAIIGTTIAAAALGTGGLITARAATQRGD